MISSAKLDYFLEILLYFCNNIRTMLVYIIESTFKNDK